MAKLKPCPFCGGEVYERRGNRYIAHKPGCWIPDHCSCDECINTPNGPMHLVFVYNADMWNRRAEPALPVEAATIMAAWPTFEDGEPVLLGDSLADHVVSEISIRSDGSQYIYADGRHIFVRPGERLRRPRPAEPADSWEKLEDDLDKTPCEYWNVTDKQCVECEHEVDQCCDIPRDILARAKALAGVSDE